MRKTGPPSEIGRLVSPILRLLDGAWQRMHWWVAAMAFLYAVSGVTVIKPDEAAVILRWGRLQGATPALQAHGPGLLFALPRPIDRVVRVPVKHVSEVRISTLAFNNGESGAESSRYQVESLTRDAEAADPRLTLDPISQGYALTGDHNIVHLEMTARYRIKDPAQWAFYGPKSEDALKVEVSAAMVRSLGEMGIDRVLSDGRKDLIATATQRAQKGLDAVDSGIELSSLELTSLTPPRALAVEFDDVQSAFIGAETTKKVAESYAVAAIPQAQADADTAIQRAHAKAAGDLAQANGDAEAFRQLAKEYRSNAAVVRERLYRDAVERAIMQAGSVRWVPPPPPGGYKGFRISIPPPTGGTRSASGLGRGGDDDDN